MNVDSQSMAVLARSAAVRSDEVSGKIAGFVIVTIAPTVFWSAIIAMLGWALGRPLSVSASVVLATIIFSFLACIWASFVGFGVRSAAD